MTSPYLMRAGNLRLLNHANQVPSQRGRRWLITGATNGIGTEIAEAAARAGADLVLPVRDVRRGQKIAEQLRHSAIATHGSGVEIDVVECDLSEADSVAAAAEAITGDIDVMINNAGAVTASPRQNSQGHELMIATNFLGPFALTNLLIQQVTSRIVIVGSGAHSMARVDATDPHYRHRRWQFLSAYAQSKLCDMLWGRALHNRISQLDNTVSRPVVQLAHPGWAFTNLQNVSSSAALNRAVTAVCRRFGQSAQAGALPVLSAAVDDIAPLSYIGPDRWRQMRGVPTWCLPSSLAQDDAAAEVVWNLGVQETGIELPDELRTLIEGP